MRAYKFLDARGRAPFTLTPWPVGEWVEAAAVVPCREGVHACAIEDLSYWLAVALWEIELEEPVTRAGNKLAARRGRLVAPIGDYRAAATELGEVCAWRARDRAIDILKAQRADELASRLAGARALSELAELEGDVELGGDVDESSAGGIAAGLAADTASFALRGPITEAPFIGACSAGHAAAGMHGDQAAFDAAFAEERAFESSWLATRLGLS
jgi:hypothetical protein